MIASRARELRVAVHSSDPPQAGQAQDGRGMLFVEMVASTHLIQHHAPFYAPWLAE